MRRSRWRTTRIPAVLVLLAAVALTGCGASARASRLVFVPQKGADAHRWKDQLPAEVASPTSATIRPGPFTVAFTILDDAERSAFLKSALGREGDPFGPAGGRPRFVTIRMDVRNGSKEELSFNPQQVILVTDAPDYMEPLDATRLHEGLAAAGESADEFLRDMHRAIYDTSVSLAGGESVSRLLVIPFPEHPFREARLECALFLVGQKSFSFDVPLSPAPGPVPEPSAPPPPVKQTRRDGPVGAAPGRA